MSKQTVTLTNSTTDTTTGVTTTNTFLTVYSSADTWDESNRQLIEFKGWNDYSNIDLQTTPKLFGKGSYVVAKLLKEKEFSVKARINQPGVRSIREDIAAVIEALAPVTVTREIVGLNGNESVEAYIIGLEWLQETDDEVEFTISFRSTSSNYSITTPTP